MISKKSTLIKILPPLKQRSLKIQPHYRVPAFNMIRPKPTRIVPSLFLCGKWLAKAGFKTGQRVKVHCSKKQLIITPEYPPVTFHHFIVLFANGANHAHLLLLTSQCKGYDQNTYRRIAAYNGSIRQCTIS